MAKDEVRKPDAMKLTGQPVRPTTLDEEFQDY